MIVKHPTRPGYLIVTPEVRELLTAPHRLRLPDGQLAHPLYFHQPDFLIPDEIDTKVFKWKLLDEIIEALALVMLDEINTLRVRAGLTARTEAQLKTAIKNRIAVEL
jgi:hypothetical protein